MKLRCCSSCRTYSFELKCLKCEKETGEAHYKFVKVKSVSEQKS